MKKSTLYIAILSFLLVNTSCRKDFAEINQNPNGFTEASDGSLFNTVLASLRSGWNEQLYVNVSVLYKQNQQYALPQVRWNNYTIGTEEIWSNYYTTLPNLRELERRWSAYDSTSHAIQTMLSMEKIVLAYKTFKVTDLFGDIPFSEAGYGYQTTAGLRPSFDSQRSIYLTCLEELAWAAEHIDPSAAGDEPLATFIQFDKLFFGDLAKWRKFANSLRLRHAMRMVNREPVLAGEIISDIISNFRPTFGVNEFGQLNDNPYTETAAIYPYALGYRNESKGWSYNQSKDPRLGSTIWQLLSANDSSDGSGIFDPRAFYFFDTNNDNEWAVYPNTPAPGMLPDGGIPYEYQRDVAYTLKGNDCHYSPVNYHLVRDMDYIPDILMTGAEVLYLRAEAFHRGIGVNKDLGQSSTEFLSGLQYSLNFWSSVMNASKLPYGTPFSADVTVPSSVNFISLQNQLGYFSMSESEQLDMIYAQSWLDMFMQPQQAFSLARRTSRTPNDGTPLSVYRFTIPPSEISYNESNWLSSFSGSSDQLTSKVWWMN